MHILKKFGVVLLILLILLTSCKPRSYNDASELAFDVDLSNQFVDPPTRNQCNTGSCQSFAAIALYENALQRQFDVKVRLSEGHLYAELLFGNMKMLKHVVDYLNDNVKTLNSFAVAEAFHAVAGEYIQTAVRHLLDNGIGFEDTAPFGAFVKRFDELKSTYEKIILSCVKSARENNMTGNILGDERTCQMFGQAQIETLMGGPAAYRTLQYQASILSKSVLRQIAIDRNPNVQSTDDLQAIITAGKQPPWDDCLTKGRSAYRNILYQLEKKRPVAVSMYVSGLSGFGFVGDHAVHAFVITGGKSDGHRVKFEIRNSWGGQNPAIYSSDMCRVLDVIALSVPKERGLGLPEPVELIKFLKN